MNLQSIRIDKLSVSELNVRTGKPNVADLVASIQSVGLMQPPTVRKHGNKFEVIAGQRRYLACKEIGLKEIPCVVVETDDAAAKEVSIAENFARVALDPIDECEAFMAMKASNEALTAQDIAARFGTTTMRVMQILALAELPDDIRNFARKKGVPIDVLKALTVAPPAKQKAWKAAWNADEWWAKSGESLRNHVTNKRIGRELAVFDIGEYTGTMTVDLFDDKAYFDDEEQFHKLQAATLESEAAKLREEGWSWVTTYPDPFNRPSTYSYGKSRNKKIAGAMVYIECDRSNGGANYVVKIDAGLIDPETVKRMEREKKKADNEAKRAEAEGTGADDDGGAALSQMMEDYFAHLAHRTNGEAILRCKNAEEILQVICDMLADGQIALNPFRRHKCGSAQIDEIGGFERLTHIGSMDFGDKRTKSERFKLLRNALAGSVEAMDIPIKRAELREVWNPTSKFFAKLDKERLAKTAEAIDFTDTAEGIRNGKVKKGEAINRIMAAFEGDTKVAGAARVLKAKTWVPPEYESACKMREYRATEEE